MLDALMCRGSVVTNPRTNSGEFVGGNAGAYTAAANKNATFGLAIENREVHGFSEIGIVARVFIKSADVQDFVAHRTQNIAHRVLKLKAGVVGTNYNFHAGLTFPLLL